jgi:hypothetical protein
VTIVLADEGSAEAGLATFRERFERLELHLLQRKWYPMTYLAIPSLLRSADALLAEMDGYAGPDEAQVRELRTLLASRRADFRRDP